MNTLELFQALLNGEVLEDSYNRLWRLDNDGLCCWTPGTCIWLEVGHTDLPLAAELKIKPRMVKINGYDVPEPLREAPPFNTTFFVVSLLYDDLFDEDTWIGHEVDMVFLERGLVHSTKENAIKHAEALLSFTMVR